MPTPRIRGFIPPALVLGLLAASCCRTGVTPPASPASAAAVVAVVDATVIPMDTERVLRRHTVLVRDGVIVTVGPTAEVKVPEGTRVVDGSGLFVVPGLVDAHVHLRDESELLSYLAHGVTTVVHLSGPQGNVPDVLALRERVARGAVPGPRILASGRLLDGNPPIYPSASTPVETPLEATRAVEAQIDAGVDVVKVYNNLRADALRAAAETAHRRGVAVWGHIPRIDGRDTALPRALAAGLDVIAHGEEIFFTALHRDVERQLDRGEAPTVDPILLTEAVRLVRSSGAAVIPDLSFVAMTRAQLDDLSGVMADPEARYLHPDVLSAWAAQNPTRRPDRARFDLRERGKAGAVRALTLALHEAGVPLLLGTDASAPGLFPGKSALVELEQLVSAGLTPYQALATGTRDAGRVLGAQVRGMPPFGTVEAGSRADLLLLRDDPLAAIGNVGAVAGVVLRGQWISRVELDAARETAVRARSASQSRPRDGVSQPR